jgi:hypothetical protein
VGEQGVSSDEDSSPELSWSGDVASAAVNWSNMSGSSSSSPPHGAEVSSSRRPREAGRDKTVGSSSRLTAPPTRVGQQLVRSPAAPSGTGTPGPQRPAPCQADPPRRSEEQSVYVRQLYDSSDRPDSNSLQRRQSRGMSSDLASTPSVPSAVERVLPHGACSRFLSGAAEPRMSLCPTSPTGAMVQLWPLRKSDGQHPSQWGECCRCTGDRPKRRSARDGELKTCRSQAGLEARRPRAGHVGPPGEESPTALKDVSLRLQLLPDMTLPTCLLMFAFVFS